MVAAKIAWPTLAMTVEFVEYRLHAKCQYRTWQWREKIMGRDAHCSEVVPIASMSHRVALLPARRHRQNQGARVLTAIQNRIGRLNKLRILRAALAGIQIALEAREIARRHFEPDAVTLQKDVARGP